MAEIIAAGTALGVVSSLITIVDVAWRVLKRLDEYSDRAKDVPTALKHIRPQLCVLAEKMDQLRQAEKDSSLSTTSDTALSKALGAFEQQIKLLDELTAKMLPKAGDTMGTRAKKAVLSIYYEKELSRIWAELETYKTTFIFHFTSMESDRNLEVEVKPLKAHYHYPTSIASHFVIRERPLQEIEDAISDDKVATNPRVVVLLGMGGCGKTQLALQYCQQSEAKRKFTSIFWVDASSPAATAQSFVTIAGFITNGQDDLKDEEVVLEIVKSRLCTCTDRWLIVFDNFDDPSVFKGKEIKDYFPRGANGAILFTTRHGDVKRLGHTVAIAEMSESEGLELLFRQTSCDRNEENSNTGKEIITRLGNLALAIDQAGAYISARNLPLGLFIDHYSNRREKVLKETPGTLWEYRRRLNPAEAETSLSVFTTWEMSFEQIGGKTEEHLLILSAFFDNADIFEDLFKSHFERKGPEWMKIFDREGNWDTYEFQGVLARLAKISLIRSFEITTSGARFSFHPLVQEWIKLRSNDQDRQNKTIEAIEMLGGFLIGQDLNNLALQLRQAILSHLNATISNEAMFLDHDSGLESKSLLYAANTFAVFYRLQAQYEKAQYLYGRILADREEASNDFSTLNIVNNLANLYVDQARLPEAEAMYNRALTGHEELLGRNHISTLETAHNLAYFYMKQGRLNEAEAIYDRALAGYEELLGRNHISSLNTVNNLAIVYRQRGRLDKAEAMCDRALAGFEEVLGRNHILTLDAVKNLAVVYRVQGRLDEAEAMCDRALAGFEGVLGRNHMSTLTTLNNLAIVYREQSRLDEAEATCDRALAGFEGLLGRNHISTLNTVIILANIYYDQGRLDEAEAMCDRALVGFEGVLGRNHISTLGAVTDLARVYREQGRLDEAEATCNRALTGFEDVLGRNHISTLTTVKILAIVYRVQGRLDEAEAMCDRALAGFEGVLGRNHMSTLDTVTILANVYSDQGRLDEAETMCDWALVGFEGVLGRNHISTLGAVTNLASVYHDQGRLDEAEATCNRALTGFEDVLGRNHISTLTTVTSLAIVYHDQGRLDEAEAMCDRVLTGYEGVLGQNPTWRINAVHNLANIYSDQGRFAQAEATYKQALAAGEKILGYHHKDTLDIVYNLGLLYQKQGNAAETITLFQRAALGYEKMLGPDHPETIDAHAKCEGQLNSGLPK